MARYLSLFTNDTPPSGPPSQEHMAQMGALIEKQMKAGKLIATGGLKKRSSDAFVVRKKGNAFTVDEKPTAEWMLAGGWAILQGETRADIVEDCKLFLNMVGDGRCEIIEIFGGPE
jgi:hypothetical protein